MIKKDLVFKSIKIVDFILALFNVFMFLAMRCCWSGISKTLGYNNGKPIILYNLPVIIFFVLVAVAIANIVLYFVMKKERNVWSFVFLGVNVLFLVVILVVIALGAIDYMYFIWPEFFKYVLLCVIVFFIVFMIFYYHKTILKDSKIFKYSLLSVVLLGSSVYVFDASFNSITYKPVVYAVEDEYQIVFGSNTNALGWVTVGDEPFYDIGAGSYRSYTKVHKVTIPMTLLDEAQHYTINVQKLTYRGPFGGFRGRLISESYDFKPVDASDGVDYYAISDIHMDKKSAAQSAAYASNKEFLVLNGDIMSMVQSERDAFYVNEIAHEITKGRIPVVYARGNHEIKGYKAEAFADYVGSKDRNFYFTFKFSNVYGIVLDIGEDHDDDFWEYYETVDYDLYRKDQIQFLKDELESKEYLKYEYRMVVCHIPVNYVNSRKNHEDVKKEMTTLLNQFDLDIALYGHQHEILIFEPNTVEFFTKLKYSSQYGGGTFRGYLTDFNFPNMLVGKHGYTQTDDDALTGNSQIGASINVNFDTNIQEVTFINSKGEKVNTVNPFVENRDYGESITIDMTTKSFS